VNSKRTSDTVLHVWTQNIKIWCFNTFVLVETKNLGVVFFKLLFLDIKLDQYIFFSFDVYHNILNICFVMIQRSLCIVSWKLNYLLKKHKQYYTIEFMNCRYALFKGVRWKCVIATLFHSIDNKSSIISPAVYLKHFIQAT